MAKDLIEMTSSVFRQMRAYRDMSQNELHSKTNIAVSTLRGIEKGTSNPRLETLQSIAEALGCNVKVSFEPIDE